VEGNDGSRSLESPRRIGLIVLRGEFGPRLRAAMPECEITVLPGETHVVVPIRDQAEAFGVLNRLRDLGAEIVRFSIDSQDPGASG
jgi:hypothetical protein